MGESFGNWSFGDDPGLRKWITTASLACGFHAGDPVTMIEAVDASLEAGIAIGAHPGLPDLLGFGRRVMNISQEDGYAYLLYQVGALSAILASRGAALHHVKPHGALGPMINDSAPLTEALLRVVEEVMDEPLLYWPAGREDSVVITTAQERGIPIVFEFYPDLEYRASGDFVLRRRSAAVQSGDAVTRVQRFLATGEVETVDGTILRLDCHSICIHGDSPTAAEHAAAVACALKEFGYELNAATRASVLAHMT
jgi:UPF0271 protein